MSNLLPFLVYFLVVLGAIAAAGFVFIRIVLPAVVRVIRREWTRE